MRNILTLVLLFINVQLLAQEKLPFKWGKVTVEDFNISSPLIDSNTNAVIIADVGESNFILKPTDGGPAFTFERKVRIKILNKNGYNIATRSIGVYNTTNGNGEEKVIDLKAQTYNVENGKVVATKVDGSQQLTERITKNWTEKKFTFPNISVGSILEYSYTIESDFLTHLREWKFQSNYPTLYSNYSVTIPEYLNYINITQGLNLKYTKESTTSRFSLTQEAFASATYHNWQLLNVPALLNEPFVTTLENYVTKVEFQLQSINVPNRPISYYTNSWEKLSKELLEHENFGMRYKGSPGWLKEETDKIIGTTTNKIDIAKKCYYFINKNFNAKSRGMYSTKSLKDVFKEKNGNVADINFLLIAALHNYGIKAEAVVLGTTEMGFTNALYPMTDRFNYTICAALIDSSVYFLDAAVPETAFGQVLPNCYNGYCRIISENPAGIELSPDNLSEEKITSVFIDNNEKGDSIVGFYSSTLGLFESQSVRLNLKKINETETFKQKIKAFQDMNFKAYNCTYENKENVEEPILKKLELASKFDEDVIYFNPMLDEGESKNPFKSATRNFPVEFPYATSETYIFNMEVPKGYVVDELPKSMRFKFEEYNSMFEYIISLKETTIQLRSKIKIGAATFKKEDYENLRNFYAAIVKKHAEQIVFKKIKN